MYFPSLPNHLDSGLPQLILVHFRVNFIFQLELLCPFSQWETYENLLPSINAVHFHCILRKSPSATNNKVNQFSWIGFKHQMAECAHIQPIELLTSEDPRDLLKLSSKWLLPKRQVDRNKGFYYCFSISECSIHCQMEWVWNFSGVRNFSRIEFMNQCRTN